MKINSKFKELIPPLKAEERELLKESIQKDGVRDALIVWNGTLIDGHNRYEICTELGLPYPTREMSFDSEEEAEAWICLNQAARRNLSDIERARLALRGKGILAKRAKERQIRTEENRNLVPQNFVEQEKGETLEILSRQAGLSRETLRKVEKIDETAPEIIKKAAGDTISIDKAYKFTQEAQKLPEPEREEKAQTWVTEEYLKQDRELDRRHRIATKLENMVFNITTNATLITDENLAYMLDGPKTASSWLNSIDVAIEALIEMRDIIKNKNRIRGIK